VAGLAGRDPLSFLALEADDFRLENLIIQEQLRIEDERARAWIEYLAKYMSQLTSGSILRGVSRIVASLFRR
jgi:hypothetical protein